MSLRHYFGRIPDEAYGEDIIHALARARRTVW